MHIRRNDCSGIINVTRYPKIEDITAIIISGIKIDLNQLDIGIFNIFLPKKSLAIEHAPIHPAITQLTETGLPPSFNTIHAIGILNIHSEPVVIWYHFIFPLALMPDICPNVRLSRTICSKTNLQNEPARGGGFFSHNTNK